MKHSHDKRREFSKGLEDVIASTTSIGCLDGKKGRLVYRGYDIVDLAEYSSFEETVFLLLYGKLPNRTELGIFNDKLISHRLVMDEVIDRLAGTPCPCHPMSLLRSGISLMECVDETCQVTQDIEGKREMGIKLISQMPTLTAAIARILNNEQPVPPNPELGHAANFLYMLKGERAEPLAEKIMDVSLILHADHGMNASTFACLVVAATLSDIHSAITAGISALKGPLHGGANEMVINMLLGLHSVEEANRYADEVITSKKKLVGFGHRVYTTIDPRAKILQQYAEDISSITGNEQLFKIARIIEKRGMKAYGKKGVCPNIDFYSGLVYHCLGIRGDMFTPIFAVSRTAGWVARIVEYLEDNRIFRPRALYVGPVGMSYVPIDERK
ncbi:MAG: citrate/2-methylcitrate synthase [Methanosarcinales archaeon]|nr:citrate synthase [ANME-2 cluster archaeon]MDF1531800.1 citrate/2-methylcitrate synthase [ANME-2 cluster archaeon]MDW7776973.1 citrate/2-methylcitrate synthase [Methanosarcinales archaeon]